MQENLVGNVPGLETALGGCSLYGRSVMEIEDRPCCNELNESSLCATSLPQRGFGNRICIVARLAFRGNGQAGGGVVFGAGTENGKTPSGNGKFP